MSILFLHLPAAGSDCHGWLSGTDGLVELGQGSPEHFARLHPGSACVFFLPSASCLFAAAAVSAKQLRQAEQALGWLIEDQTGDDVEDLHVVAGPQAGELTPLIAISRQQLQELLASLRSAGLMVVAALPDLLLVPRDDSAWQLVQRHERIYLRTGYMSGAVLEAEALELMLDGALLEQGGDRPLAISLAIGNAELGSRVERWAEQHDGVSCRLAENLDVASALAAVPDWSRHPANLLQGEFASRRRFQLGAGLRLAAGFLVAAFALQLLSEWVHYGYYRYQAGRVGDLAVSRYRTLYAEERLPANAANALQEVQKRMRGRRNENRSDSSVLPVLTRVAESLQGSGLNTQRVDFLGGVLTLDVDAHNLAELDGLKQKLDGQGFNTEILSANAQGGIIRGRLRVEGGA